MNLTTYLRLLKTAFIANLFLMGTVLIDFVYLGQRYVTTLVVAYMFLVGALVALWASRGAASAGRHLPDPVARPANGRRDATAIAVPDVGGDMNERQ